MRIEDAPSLKDRSKLAVPKTLIYAMIAMTTARSAS
jgi:hypothetical protein